MDGLSDEMAVEDDRNRDAELKKLRADLKAAEALICDGAQNVGIRVHATSWFMRAQAWLDSRE